MESGAMFDVTGDYRYTLWREWDERRSRVAIAMLNPSVAIRNSCPTESSHSEESDLWFAQIIQLTEFYSAMSEDVISS